MQITSDGSVFGKIDPGIIADVHAQQNLFTTKMISYRMHHGRHEVIIKFRTKIHMPTIYMTAGTYPGLASVEVLTSDFVIVSTPFRSPDDVELMRQHFTDIWQMSQFSK